MKPKFVTIGDAELRELKIKAAAFQMAVNRLSERKENPDTVLFVFLLRGIESIVRGWYNGGGK